MRSWAFLFIAIAFVAASQAAIYPWIPLPPWWFRAPDKDTPPVVNIQQHGGNYHLSSIEGKAYQALSPASVVQPPVSAVHVQSVPAASLQYLQNGQAIVLISPAVPQSAAGTGDAGSGTVTEAPGSESTEPGNVADQDPPREPAPVTEQSEDYDATESS